MQYANAFDLQVSKDGAVSFLNGTRQVLRFCVLEDHLDLVPELGSAEVVLDSKTVAKLNKLEKRRSLTEVASKKVSRIEVDTVDLKTQVAAMKLQRCLRGWL